MKMFFTREKADTLINRSYEKNVGFVDFKMYLKEIMNPTDKEIQSFLSRVEGVSDEEFDMFVDTIITRIHSSIMTMFSSFNKTYVVFNPKENKSRLSVNKNYRKGYYDKYSIDRLEDGVRKNNVMFANHIFATYKKLYSNNSNFLFPNPEEDEISTVNKIINLSDNINKNNEHKNNYYIFTKDDCFAYPFANRDDIKIIKYSKYNLKKVKVNNKDIHKKALIGDIELGLNKLLETREINKLIKQHDNFPEKNIDSNFLNKLPETIKNEFKKNYFILIDKYYE